MTASARFLELCAAPAAELERLFAAGRAPEPSALAGFEWRGANTPWHAGLLGIRKFVKGFFAGPRGVEGYNIPVAQDGLGAPWREKPSPEAPRRFGFFLVSRPGPSVVLDYGASPRNPRWRPERLLRDYVVELPGGLLLGRAYLDLGALRVPASWFALERLRPTGWRPGA